MLIPPSQNRFTSSVSMTTCSWLGLRGHVALTFPSLGCFCRRPGLCQPLKWRVEVLRLWRGSLYLLVFSSYGHGHGDHPGSVFPGPPEDQTSSPDSAGHLPQVFSDPSKSTLDCGNEPSLIHLLLQVHKTKICPWDTPAPSSSVAPHCPHIKFELLNRACVSCSLLICPVSFPTYPYLIPNSRNTQLPPSIYHTVPALHGFFHTAPSAWETFAVSSTLVLIS